MLRKDRLNLFGKGKYKIEDKIIFGTDFSMVLLKAESYSQYTRQIMELLNRFDPGLFYKISKTNPMKFLNFKTNGKQTIMLDKK